MASEKITAIIESVKALTVLELSELVKAIEEEFGVSAAALWMKRLRRYPFRLRKKTTLCAHFFVRSAARFFTQKSAGAY